MIRVVGALLTRARRELERRLLGVTAEEIRYTFEDVRGEIRANHAELLQQIARLRDDVDKIAARSEGLSRTAPIAEA